MLGLALGLFTEVEVRTASRLIIETEGEGSEYAADATHLAARVATEVAGTDRLYIRVRSDVPVGRGLGSSAALVAATAARRSTRTVLIFMGGERFRFPGAALQAAAGGWCRGRRGRR